MSFFIRAVTVDLSRLILSANSFIGTALDRKRRASMSPWDGARPWMLRASSSRMMSLLALSLIREMREIT